MPRIKPQEEAAAHPGAEQGGRQSLRDQAYVRIKRRIIALDYKPGAYINEAMICDDLGIGRTPVHLALERRAVDGLIEVIPRKGLIVAPLSLDEMRQINEVRKLLEPAAASLAARWATDDDSRSCRVNRARISTR